MDIKDRISKVAKEIQATMFYDHQALDYLTKAGYRSDLEVTYKDQTRILDMNKKANGNMGKYFSLVNQMAGSIRDPQKAYRRGMAILKYAEVPRDMKFRFASVFFEKAISLG